MRSVVDVAFCHSERGRRPSDAGVGNWSSSDKSRDARTRSRRPGSGAVSDGPPRQRSIHVVKGPDRGKTSSAAGGESVHSGTGADLYVRWSNVAANPNVTSGERTYRQGSDRPCAGLRWPRTANPASGQSLHLPSALYDAHPPWRTPKIWTVHRHQGREPACERCRRDDGTARRSTASVAGTGADDDPSSRRRPFRSPSRSHVQPPPLPVPRSATALRKRPRTDVRSAWSSASSESGLNRPAFSFDQCSVLAYTWRPRTGHAATNGALPAGAASLPRLGRSGGRIPDFPEQCSV